MTDKLDYIRMSALSLAVGQTEQVECPSCHKPKLSLTRTDSGILYNCWRPSCTMRGIVGSSANSLTDQPYEKQFVARPYMRPTSTLTHEFWEKYLSQYDTPRPAYSGQTVKQTAGPNEATLVMPLFTAKGEHFGVTTKSWLNSQKAGHYLIKEVSPPTHFVRTAGDLPRNTAVLVEDVLSAIKVKYFSGLRGVALLGTSFEEARVRQLRDGGITNVLLWLDPDAQHKQMVIKKKYGIFFDQFSCVYSDKDPKDTKPSKLKELLGDNV